MNNPKQNRYFFHNLIKNLSITEKTVIITLAFIIFLTVAMVANLFTVEIVTTVRAYVSGEGIYSKTQKDAIYSLIKYSKSRDETDYKHFLNSMEIPMAGRRARIELEKSVPDLQLARQALIEHGSDPDDIKNIIRLFTMFRAIGPVHRTITEWEIADNNNVELIKLTEKLHEVILNGENNRKQQDAILAKIDHANQNVGSAVNAFSNNINDLAQLALNFSHCFVILIFIIFIGTGIPIFILISNDTRKKILLLHNGVEKIARSNSADGIGIDSTDELGRLARSFEKISTNFLAAKSELQKKNLELTTAHEDIIKSRDKALEGSRLKSEFLSNMSHEIRTPMNGVLGMTSILLATELTDEQLEFVKIIRNSGDSLITIINDILDYSKIEAGKLDFEIIDFNLIVTMDEVTDLMAIKASEKSLQYTAVVSKEVPPFLCGDPGRLRQILINIVGNAIKFTQEGEISVRTSLDHEETTRAVIRFSISDTGVGIPKDKIDRLFKSFSQADGSTTRKFGGTGLGLAISKQLAEQMGGKIGVKSEQGKGSEFWFTAVFEKQPENKNKDFIIPGDTRKTRILIVDDNRINRYVLKEQLKLWGYQYSEAQDSIQALEELHLALTLKNPFKIAIIDMYMPGMNGDILGQKIKQNPGLKNTNLIMMTSMGKRGDVKQLQKIGFTAYLTKPVKQWQLYECLSKVAGIKKETAEEKPPALITRHSISDDQKRKIRILIAEDNRTNQMVILKILNKLGYSADAVANGKEAVEALEIFPYAAVLMDCQMPELDGYDATRIIRNPESETLNHKVPVIALTASAMQGDRERCIKAGMDDYLSKPIDTQKLYEMLEKWISFQIK